MQIKEIKENKKQFLPLLLLADEQENMIDRYITVVALMSSDVTDSSLTYHLENAKAHGVTRREIAAIITHVGFYAGWPKAWAVFHLAKEVWNESEPEQRRINTRIPFCIQSVSPITVSPGILPAKVTLHRYPKSRWGFLT